MGAHSSHDAALGLALLLALPAVAPAQAQRLDALAAAIVAASAPQDGDADAQFKALLEAARTAASSPASSVAVDLASRLIGQLARPRDAQALVDAFLAAAPHGLGRQSGAVLATRLLRHTGDIAAAQARDPYARHARQLLVIGPFGDASDDYTGVPFEPELALPRAGASLAGRYRAVLPRVVTREPHRPTVRLRDPARPDEVGCWYALLQVRAAEPLACYLEVACGGSYELFAGDERVTTVFRADGWQPDRRYVPLRLTAGVNHVLLKTTSVGQDDVSLRFVDAAAMPIAEGVLAELPAGDPLPRDRGELPPELGPFQDDLRALRSAAANAPSDATAEQRDTLALASVFAAFERGDERQACEVLTEYDERAPEAPALRLALAAALDRASVLPREIRAGRVRTLLASVQEALQGHLHADAMRASQLADEDKPEDAIRLLEARLVRHPGEAPTYAQLHRILGGLKFTAEATAVLERWRTAVPHDPRPVLSLASELAAGGARERALDLVLAALEASPSMPALLRRAIELGADLGRSDLCDRLLARLFADDPDDLGALAALSATRRARGDQAGALDADLKLAQREDADAGAIAAAAERLAAGGRTEDAVAAYRRALALDPSRHATRRLLAHLDGSAEFPLIARFRRDGEAVVAAFKPDERETTSVATLVLDQTIVQVEPDGSYVAESHTIRRINDLRGVETHGEADVASNADEVVLVRTIGTDKLTYVPNRVQGAFAMPRLEPGAFVEQIARNFRPAPRGKPWQVTPFLFQSVDEPFVLSEYVLILPPGHRGAVRTRHFAGHHEKQELDGGYEALVFRCENMPRLRTESSTPPIEELVPVVAYGQDRGLAARARDAYARARRTARSSEWVARKARELCAGVDGDRARAQKLYDWAHATISGERGAADPTEILLRGTGPRFFLLVALLDEAGVPFRQAVTHLAVEGLRTDAAPLFTDEDDFAMPALRIEPRDGAVLWMFADNARYQPLGTIPPERFGAAALLLGRGTHELVRLPGGDLEQELGWRFDGRMTLGQDGGAVLQLSGHKRGESGYAIAEQVRDLPDTHRSVVARQIASQIAPGWTVASSTLKGLEPGQQFVAEAELRRRDALENAGEDLLLPLPAPPIGLVAEHADRAERELPLRMGTLDADEWRIAIDPGEHFKIAAVPSGIEVRSELLDYSLTFRHDGRTLTAIRKVAFRPGTIAPDAYPDWLRTLRAIDAVEQGKIRLRASIPSSSPAQDR